MEHRITAKDDFASNKLKNAWAFAKQVDYMLIHFKKEKRYSMKLESNEIRVDK